MLYGLQMVPPTPRRIVWRLTLAAALQNVDKARWLATSSWLLGLVSSKYLTSTRWMCCWLGDGPQKYQQCILDNAPLRWSKKFSLCTLFNQKHGVNFKTSTAELPNIWPLFQRAPGVTIYALCTRGNQWANLPLRLNSKDVWDNGQALVSAMDSLILLGCRHNNAQPLGPHPFNMLEDNELRTLVATHISGINT